MGLLCVSCKQTLDSSKNTESELIEKINAVQHQMMVQGNISEEEELAMSSLCNLMTRDDEFDNYSPAGRILFKDIENAPIYNGCEGLSEEETKKCFNESISIFLKQEFNLSISNAIGLSEPQQVAAFFVIDENGKLTGMKIRDADVTIQSEIVRILKKIPKMKPAIQDGINVPVLCSFLLTYGSELKIELVYIPEGPSA
tara:strand:- start:4676 stop:5272 length:597 start_codon:yes stop_codon:yes gene_type:complete